MKLWTLVLEKTSENFMESQENKWILEQINAEVFFSGTRLKLFYFGYIMQRPCSLGEGSNAGKGSRKKKKRMSSNKVVELSYSGNGGIFGRCERQKKSLPTWPLRVNKNLMVHNQSLGEHRTAKTSSQIFST